MSAMDPQRPPVWSSWDSLQQGNKVVEIPSLRCVKEEGTGGRKSKTIKKKFGPEEENPKQ